MIFPTRFTVMCTSSAPASGSAHSASTRSTCSPACARQSTTKLESGQEELYVALSGDGVVVVEGERFPLDPQHVTRVSPVAKRYMEGGPDGLRALCIGGTPGHAYEPPAWTEPAE